MHTRQNTENTEAQDTSAERKRHEPPAPHAHERTRRKYTHTARHSPCSFQRCGSRRSRPSPSIAKEASIIGVIATSEVVVVASLEDGSGATGGAAGAADCAASVGGGAGVAGSGGWTRPGTAVVIGVEGRHGAEVGAQACIPPRRLAGSGVNPALYLAFSASGSAFHIWPGVCKGRGGLGKRGPGEITGWGRAERGNMGLGKGGVQGKGR